MGKRIEKKILPGYFKAVVTGRKTFELRKDDADYQVGDILVLHEYDGEKYTGRKCTRVITHILRQAERYGLMHGYCILSIQPVNWNDLRPSAREGGKDA